MSKPHSGHTFIPWLWSVSQELSISSSFQWTTEQGKWNLKYFHHLLISSFCLKCQHALERQAGQSPERCQVSGKRIWFHVKGMVIWQWRTYPISSTVVAKGLCQQDRKKKLILLPLAFGMATDFIKAFRESVLSYPGREGNRNGSNHSQPPRRNGWGESASQGWGGSPLSGLGVWICLGKHCPSAAGSTRAHKTLLKRHETA